MLIKIDTREQELFTKCQQTIESVIKFKEAPEFHQIVQAKDFWLDTTKLQTLGFTQSISTDKIIKQLCTT